MDRYNRWEPVVRKGDKPVKPVRHAHVSFHLLVCEDCGTHLHQTHPAYLGERCRRCWEAMQPVVLGVGHGLGY